MTKFRYKSPHASLFTTSARCGGSIAMLLLLLLVSVLGRFAAGSVVSGAGRLLLLAKLCERPAIMNRVSAASVSSASKSSTAGCVLLLAVGSGALGAAATGFLTSRCCSILAAPCIW